MADDESSLLPVPNLGLQQKLFLLTRPSAPHADKEEARTALLKGIEDDEMAPYYASIVNSPDAAVAALLKRDAALLKRLEEKNEEALRLMDESIKKNEEEEGESEVNAVLRQKASYLAKIGDKTRALEAHRIAIEKAAGLGSRLDLTLAMIRIGLFHGDPEVTVSSIAKAKLLVEEGGDWDRRNRLKVYEGLHLLSIRDFKRGGELFLDALSTFTATELLEYNDFITLTVLSNILSLPRTELKKKIIDSPEVLQVVDDIPHLRTYVTSLYACEYATFFQALAEVEQTHLLPSRLLAPHARYYVREMRIIGYAQLLESYRSLTLDNMAQAFGVSSNFIDAELSRFIASGRLPAVIDRVAGVVETRRPDFLSGSYGKLLKDGDLLLNSLQRLSRTVL
ncbi:putative RPN7-subunit of the regulatory particle of the proteasome [Acaromyces ingoldii]|uniref:Putative RPN7-subunit of the regulatory particle of the proteasome n=1 Tax=Acaromyces ingoldii TaxID=215250 RepID=A0A316YFS9_9BASI|nr:putative RPN7-subunit of the regulatory particle of the proteasome [Acaromyces ingoldii]PWN87926.1 putative RPN7-subunit of the regulatory particle of the proteasome [Acaromyces ingoldii]